MTGFVANINDLTLRNENFRQVLFSGQFCQLVVMSLAPGEEIGTEVHQTVDQFFRIEEGNGKIVMNGEETEVKDDDVVIVPAGTQHNLVNLSLTDHLKLYTIYSPPQHKDGTVHKTKLEAEADENDHR